MASLERFIGVLVAVAVFLAACLLFIAWRRRRNAYASFRLRHLLVESPRIAQSSQAQLILEAMFLLAVAIFAYLMFIW
jgi:hypothetical protein